MQIQILFLALIVLSLVGYAVGRSRAIAAATGEVRLHSLPKYHGLYVALWCGLPALLASLLWLAAAALIYLAARRYDLGRFLGLLPSEQGMAPDGLDTGGILAHVRHPWYLAALLLLWGRDLTHIDLVVNGILSVYIAAGSALEERKLARAYGDVYRAYQQRVPMLFPWRSIGTRWRA